MLGRANRDCQQQAEESKVSFISQDTAANDRFWPVTEVQAVQPSGRCIARRYYEGLFVILPP